MPNLHFKPSVPPQRGPQTGQIVRKPLVRRGAPVYLPAATAERVLAVVSVLLLSRPGWAVLDFPIPTVGGSAAAAEWRYLTVLLLLRLLVLYVLFRRAEKGWPKLLR